MAIRMERSETCGDDRDRPARGAATRSTARPRAALADAFRAFERRRRRAGRRALGRGRHVLRRRRSQGARHRARGDRVAPTATGRWARPGMAARQAGDRRGRRATRWRAGSSSRCGATCGSPGATRCFGVFCRRWGVPLIDGGTVRLPRLDRPGPRARPDPHRPPGRRRRGARDRPRQPRRPGRPGARGSAEALAPGSPRFRLVRAQRPAAPPGRRRAAVRRRRWPTSSRSARPPRDTGESQAGARRFAAGAGRHGQF